MPLILRAIVILTGLRTFRPVPASHRNDVAIEPLCDSVGVSLMMHVRPRVEAPILLIEYTCLLEVGLRVGDSAAGHVDLAANFNALLVPHGLEIVVLDQPFTL